MALYATVKGREKIPQASFNTNLSSYSKANSDLSNLSPDENAIASHFINQTDKKGTIGGAAKRQLGLQFHINKPYFPTLRVYTGRTIELIETSNAIAAITNNSDWIYARYNQVGLELLYHPFQ